MRGSAGESRAACFCGVPLLGWLAVLCTALSLSCLCPLAQAAQRTPSPVALTGSEISAESPNVAVNAQGDALALWEGVEQGHSVLRSAFKPSARPWQPAESAPGIFPITHQVALNADGDAITLVSSNGLGSAFKPAGRPWLAPETILPELDTSVVPFQTLDVLYPYAYEALNAQGDAVAAWDVALGRRATSDVVQVALRPAGGTWGTPTTLSPEGQQAGAPQLAIDARGDAIVVWVQSESAGQDTEQSAFRPAGGSWASPSTVPTETQDLGDPQVALDARGDALVVSEHVTGVEEGLIHHASHSVQSAVRLAGGSWQPPEEVSEPNPGVAEPQLAMNAHGEAVVVWNRGNLTESVVTGAFGGVGKRWQRPKDLSRANLFPTAPRVALDAHGDAVAVWVGKNGSRYYNTVRASIRLAGRTWMASHALSRSGQLASEPDVGMDERGHAVAVWRAERGKESVIQASVVSLPRRTKHSTAK